jgi:hypothetical protein
MTSRVLAKKGFHVISACLTDEGMKRLEDVVSVCVCVCLSECVRMNE